MMNNLKYNVQDLKKDKNISNMIPKLAVIVVISVLAISTILLYINNAKNTDFGYDLYVESENLVISNSSFQLIGKKYYINYGNLEIINENIEEITDIRLMSDDRLIIATSGFLPNPSQENQGYGELFPNEVVKNIDNWYYEITYIINGKKKTETIKVENRKWDINHKSNPI